MGRDHRLGGRARPRRALSHGRRCRDRVRPVERRDGRSAPMTRRSSGRPRRSSGSGRGWTLRSGAPRSDPRTAWGRLRPVRILEGERPAFRPVPARLPARARGPHAGVVHAPGGPLPARVPRAARRPRHPRDLQATRTWSRRSRCSRCGGWTLDAAILFSDIMVPLAAVGVAGADRAGPRPGGGRPRSARAPTSRGSDRSSPSSDVPEVLEAIRLLRDELSVPLIGFAGAPFTLASYLIEGGPSRTHERTKALMLGDPHDVGRPDASARRHRRAAPPRAGRGRRAGAAGVRLVGGRARPGRLPAPVLPHMSHAVRASSADLGVPLIHFGVGTGELLRCMRRAGGDVIGVDWRTPLDDGWDRVGGPRSRPCRATSIRPCCSRAVGRGRARGDRGPGGARAGATATSSTWATACCRTTARRRSHALVDLVHDRDRTGSPRERRAADRRARDGLRHRERPRRHRALLHGHPRRPRADARSTCRS